MSFCLLTLSLSRSLSLSLTPQCLRTLVGHTGGVWSSQMRDNIIISGSTDRTLKVWDAETGECIHTLYGHTSTVRCMHLHEKRYGRHAPLHPLPPCRVTGFAFSPGPSLIQSGGRHGTLRSLDWG